MSPAPGALDAGEPADLHVGVAHDAASDTGCELPDGPLHELLLYLLRRFTTSAVMSELGSK